MPARNPRSPAVAVESLTLRLSALLEHHGLTVAPGRDHTIQVRNQAGYADDPHGRELHPGMEQRVMTVWHDDRLWWAWVWTMRGAPPEVERMVPVDDIDEAARRIANVVRVGEPGGAGR